MNFESDSLALLAPLLRKMGANVADLPDLASATGNDELLAVLSQTAERMQDNYPYAHPFYAGQMLKPPHPVARLAYMLALWVNPNNHALDGGRASSAMEKEAVANLAEMFGFPKTFLGHLTSGGTVANLEALWVAGKLSPGKRILASSQAHYTHDRICGVLGLNFSAVGTDEQGRMDMSALEAALRAGDVGCVVATLGTTGIGSVDPLDEILELRKRYDFRVHVDSAYGGYFRLANTLGDAAQRAFEAIPEADSIVVDPHKHGLQPYGCGSVLFRDAEVGRFYKHGSPYTYFSSDELHLGEISLECSRAGASAVALWSTQQLLPMERGGVFSGDLDRCLAAARALYRRLQEDDEQLTVLEPELDIVVWAPRAGSASEISQRSSALFEEAARDDLHLATMTLPAEFLASRWPDVTMDQDSVICMRSCLIKPEHLDWLDEIWKRYKTAQQRLSC